MNKKPFCLAGMRHRSERGLVGPEWAMCCKIRTDNMCSAHIVILSCNIPLASNEAKWNWFIFLEQNVLPLNNSMAEAEVSLAQATPRSKELNAAHAESVQREKHVMKLTLSIVTWLKTSLCRALALRRGGLKLHCLSLCLGGHLWLHLRSCPGLRFGISPRPVSRWGRLREERPPKVETNWHQQALGTTVGN